MIQYDYVIQYCVQVCRREEAISVGYYSNMAFDYVGIYCSVVIGNSSCFKRHINYSVMVSDLPTVTMVIIITITV